MFAKLIAVILALGVCGGTLLALRQSRLQVASELAQTQLRIEREDEQLWVLRARIAARVTPSEVERMAADVGPLRPLVAPVLAEAKPKPNLKPDSKPESNPTRVAQRETHR